MNFYIFSSKTFRIIGLFVLTLITLFCAVNMVLRGYVLLTTNEQNFIQEIASKAKHMQIKHQGNPPDIIFVGNSHTEYHVSTQTFKNHGIDIYNYGVSGSIIPHYIYMSDKAADLKPEYVVISLPVEALYRENIEFKAGMHFIDVQAILDAPFGLKQKLGAVKAYLTELHATRIYAEPINDKIVSLYGRFTPRKPNQLSTTTNKNTAEKEPFNPDCKIIDKSTIGKNLFSYKCYNGDLIMDGVDIPTGKMKTVTLDKPNQGKISLLRKMADNLTSKNVKAIFILEPSRTSKLTFNAGELQKAIGATVINLSNLQIPQDMWGDGSHLNIKGRSFYSNILAKKLEFIKTK